jgi:ribosomal-protein-alanine N-acetyltransferase
MHYDKTDIPVKMPDSIRLMEAGDLTTVHAIEIRAYEFPWTMGIFRECLKAGYPAWVALQQQKIVGYGIISVAAGESHILNICVDPDYQRRGIGKKLFSALLTASRILGANRIYLEVRKSNRRALLMYENFGFDEIGERKRYYRDHDGKEDAIVLARDINPIKN